MNRYILFIVLTCSVQALLGQNPDSLWQKIKEDYTSQDYQSVITNSETIVTIAGPSADVFRTMANAYYRLNKNGMATLYYEKALLLNVGDPLAKNNLDVLYNQEVNPIIRVKPFFLYQWWEALFRTFSPFSWGIIAIILLLMASVLTYIVLFPKAKENTRRYKMVLLLLIVMTTIALFSGYHHYKYVYHHPYAIVIDVNSVLYEGPDERSDTVKKLYPGAKLLLLDKIGKWLKVSSMDKEQGWILSESVEKISLSSG